MKSADARLQTIGMIDVAVGDQRPELLVAAQRAWLQLLDPGAERVLQQRSRRARGDEIVPFRAAVGYSAPTR